MDCRIYDPKIVIRDGSFVSVLPDHFGDDERTEKFYGIVVRLIQDGKQARVKWNEDGATSIENIDDLLLHNEIEKKKKKFQLRILQPTDFEVEQLAEPLYSSSPGI